MRIEVIVPIKIVSELNLSEHWSKKHKRHKMQCTWLGLAFAGKVKQFYIPCQVTITRIAPRSLDEDNMIGACKNIRDYIADMLIPGLAAGRSDGDNRITWHYKQEKGKPKEYACKISIESAK